MNSYRDFVTGFAKLFREGKSISAKTAPRRKKSSSPNPSVVLIFSPHPDDECIVGGLPLRFLRETGARVVNVAVTLGSDVKRRPARLRELRRACDALGFELEQATPNGLENINPETRSKKPKVWDAAVKVVASILTQFQPRAIFFPHQGDHHSTHIGTHWLVIDALRTMPKTFTCALVETEFWGQMASPNLLVESSVEDVATLVSALSLHVGEARRNPYHLRLPAWMQDNVRRGAELITGKGSAAPDFIFGTIYWIHQWKDGRVEDCLKAGESVGTKSSVNKLFR